MSTLFTDEKPKPYAEYPPNDAYLAVVLIGFIPLACFVLAPLFAYKYPSQSWRWGMWACAPSFIGLLALATRRYGFFPGLLSGLANPIPWLALIFCCLLALIGARVGMSRIAEK